jgi:3-hydroxy acid dehydrogenase/malonic semialdehyde reductase
MPDLSQETVFITGASAGFGEAVARRFAAQGARLVLAARRVERLEKLKSELKTPVHAIGLDVRDNKAVEAAVAWLPKDFSQVTILVNNAGLALGLEPAHKTDLTDWETMVDTNIKGLMYMTRALLPGMVERNKGHVINIGSVAGSYPYPGGNCYGGTKAFVRQFTLNLKADLLGTNLRATCIEPGMAETEFSLVRFKGDPAKADKVYEGLKPLTADDIAECIYWTATLPAHVNITAMEVMPVQQAYNHFAVDRRK